MNFIRKLLNKLGMLISILSDTSITDDYSKEDNQSAQGIFDFLKEMKSIIYLHVNLKSKNVANLNATFF